MLATTNPAVPALIYFVKSTSDLFFEPGSSVPELEEGRDFLQLEKFNSEERNNVQRDTNKWFHIVHISNRNRCMRMIGTTSTLTEVDYNNQTIFNNSYVANLLIELNGKMCDEFEVLPYN